MTVKNPNGQKSPLKNNNSQVNNYLEPKPQMPVSMTAINASGQILQNPSFKKQPSMNSNANAMIKNVANPANVLG